MKYGLKMVGSSVVPDLLETMNRLFAGLIFASAAFTCAGSVESSTWRRGKLGTWPKVLVRTSGQRLDPPMPSKSMSVKASLRISAASRLDCSLFSILFLVMSSHARRWLFPLFFHKQA